MIERLAGKVLQRLLAKYCDVENPESLTMGVWSGFVSLQDLNLKVDVLNKLLSEKGIPVNLHQVHISRLEITIPWNQLGKRRRKDESNLENCELVVLLDGVHVLASADFGVDDEAMREHTKEKRQKALAQGLQVGPRNRWRDTLRRRLQDGILQQLANQLQIHVRNVHVRLESEEHEFACGLVCESLHLQNDSSTEQDIIPKVAQINHFGIYLNAVERTRQSLPVEQSLLTLIPASESIAALDRSIARRMSVLYPDSLSSKVATAPKHTYLLIPVDATIAMQFSTDPRSLSKRPALRLDIAVQAVTWSIRDFQCFKLMILSNEINEHDYRLKHFRRYRPQTKVIDDPKAWWRYSIKAVRYELREHRLRWSWGRFRRRFEQRKRYCDLYERKMIAEARILDVADDSTVNNSFVLTDAEANELHRMDDGDSGDLGVADILLFQAIVAKRVGSSFTAETAKPSWFRRALSTIVSSDTEAEEEYNRLMAYIDDRVDEDDHDMTLVGVESMVALSFSMIVKSGRVVLFSPLSFTSDLTELKRLQEEFLELNFVGSSFGANMMGDFESVLLSMKLQNYTVDETRTDKSKHVVVKKGARGQSLLFGSKSDPLSGPLLSFSAKKNPRGADDASLEFIGRVNSLHLNLCSSCEWISRIKLLLRPFPQLRNASKFWSDLSMANINSWASRNLSFRAKTQTALSGHRNLALDIKIDCPTVTIHVDENIKLEWDLGQAVIRTEKNAGIVDARIVDSMSQSRTARGSLLNKGNEISLFQRDDTSLRTPPQSTGPLTGSGLNPITISPVRFDYSFSKGDRERNSQRDFAPLALQGDVLDVGSVFSQSKKSADSIFYDIYEVRICTGILALIQGIESNRILDEMEFRVSMHKSIIPADLTLCRLKTFVSIEKVMVSLSESKLVCLRNFVNVWKAVAERDLGMSYTNAPRVAARRDILEGYTGGIFVDDDDQSVDENEFFDAVGSQSIPLGDASAMFSDAWISDSNSMLDVETRSFTKSVRSGRRRARSVSDLSSLSDTSKRHVPGIEAYLNAENLAMLEEAADESKASSEYDDDASFHSAVSLSQVIDVSKEVEENMKDLERKIAELRTTLSSVTLPISLSIGERKERKQRRLEIQVEIDRTSTELRAMRLVNDDLLLQIETTCAETEIETPVKANLSTNISKSVKVASALMMSRKRDARGDVSHKLVNSSHQDQFQLWFSVSTVEVQYTTQVDAEKNASILLNIQRSAVVLRHSLAASRILFSVERCYAAQGKTSPSGLSSRLFLCGGGDPAVSSKLLPSVFPQFCSSSSSDEKLLRGTVEMRRSGLKIPNPRLVKICVAFGDVEATLEENSLQFMRHCLKGQQTIKSDAVPGMEEQVVRGVDIQHTASAVGCFEVSIQVSSARLLAVDDSGAGAALSLNGISFRGATSRSRLKIGDRTQGQLLCDNFQALSISDYDNGIGSEVLAKQDLYNPVFELHIRAQEVPTNELGGWVVEGSQNVIYEKEVLDTCTNVHVGCKVDCMESHLSAEHLTNILRVRSMMKAFESVKPVAGGELRPSTPLAHGLLSRGIRWRLDFAMGKSFVMLQGSKVSNDCSTLLATTRVRLIAQLASLPDSKTTAIQVKAKFEDTSLSVVSIEDSLMSPFAVTVDCRLPSLGSITRAESEPVNQLRLPEKHHWSVFDSLSEDLETHQAFSCLDGISIVLHASPLRLNIWMTGLVVMQNVFNDFVKCLSHGNSVPSRNESESSDSFGACVNVESLHLKLLKDIAVTQHSSAISLIDVAVDKMCFYNNSSSTKCCGGLDIMSLSMHDLTCSPGIRVFRGEQKLANGIGQSFLSFVWGWNRDEDRIDFDVTVEVRAIRFLLLPSFIKTVVSFLNSSKMLHGHSEQVTESVRVGVPLPFGSYKVNACCEVLEIVLPSKDLAKSIRESVDADIGVVVLRLQPQLTTIATVACFNGLSVPSIPQVFDGEDCSSIKLAFDSYLKRRRSAADAVFSVLAEMSCRNVKILRTSVRRTPCLASSNRVVFEEVSQIGSEKRITNEFDFCVRVNHVAVWSQADSFTPVFASSVDVQFGLVDVLVYISQSSGGMTDAIRSSVLPCAQMLGSGGGNTTNTETIIEKEGHGFLRDLVCGPAVVSVRGEGVLVTCVPGGATRLTESPIVKLLVARLACCGAATPASISKQPDTVEHATPNRNYLLSFRTTFEVSADYHNRRLVVWEPLVEPWTPTVSLRFCLQGPDLDLTEGMPSTSPTKVDHIQTPGVTRLREFGRLLRSSFKAEERAAKQEMGLRNLVQDDGDFCYLLLVLSATKPVMSALSKPITSSLLKSALDIVASEYPEQWIQLFAPDKRDLKMKAPSFTFSLEDTKPLNVNLTGSLLELTFEYLAARKSDDSSRDVPHTIRNDTGLTVRFQEVRDIDLSNTIGTPSSKFVVKNGSEVPLSLLRSSSQSCDPHKGFISIELGNFEDTIGRLDHDRFPSALPQEERFYFKATAKIPVDTVGIFKFPLDWNLYSSTANRPTESPGVLLVRIALKGSSKVVSLESPLSLRNISVSDLVVESRSTSNEALLWSSLLPRETFGDVRTVPIPLDLVSVAHERNCRFSLREATNLKLPNSNRREVFIRVPRPFSKRFLHRGIVGMADVQLSGIRDSPCHVNVCGIRIGSLGLDQLKANDSGRIPEQRMILFRSQAVFWNHLAFPVEIQSRVLTKAWVALGCVDVGESVGWDGADPHKEVEIRFRILEKVGVSHPSFPNWSEKLSVRPANQLPAQHPSFETKIEVIDKNGTCLNVKVRIDSSHSKGEPWSQNESNVREASVQLEAGSRAFRFYAPYWIVDNTGLNLEYKTATPLAAQSLEYDWKKNVAAGQNGMVSLGLNELLYEQTTTYLGMQPSFQVLMVGDNKASKLQIRCRLLRSSGPWSDAIPLSLNPKSRRDVYVHNFQAAKPEPATDDLVNLLSLSCKMTKGSRKLGGELGTKLVHVFCRYAIQNELGRDVEIKTLDRGKTNSVVIIGDGRARAFHIYESRAICFRPNEFGWDWSGSFHISSDSRKELTFILRHKMREDSLQVKMECVSRNDGGTCTIFLRPALHLPCRIENKCRLPLQFQQNPSLFSLLVGTTHAHKDNVILPFHSADFAWEQPESRNKQVFLKSVDFSADSEKSENLGLFALDDMIPGTRVKLTGNLVAHIVSDGPTRVLRVVESTTKDHLKPDGLADASVDGNKIYGPTKSFGISIRLSHGVGLSLVDWKPQELLYLWLDDISLDYTSDGASEVTEFVVTRVLLDNCLWVTPYPVAARAGTRNRKRRKRRYDAFRMTCRRSLSKQAQFDDVTLVQSIEVSTEPSILSIDGKLAEKLVDFTLDFRRLGHTKLNSKQRNESRNEELRDVLHIADTTQGEREGRLSEEALFQDDLYSAVDSLATTAIASKLRTRYRAPTKSFPTNATKASESLDRKFYVERLRISTTAAELSWSGSLPLALSLPRWMRPSLTFEGFPLFLRPYSASHVYGTAEEHLLALKTHYLSFWRVLDVLVGTMRPIFIVRACYFTTREILASVSLELALGLESSANSLANAVSVRSNDHQFTRMCRKLISPLMDGTAASFRFLSTGLSTSSTMLRYDAAHHIASGGLVRARNPRLFAHVEGKETLVEYVDGENDGKALLSRVRMGVHLGEGYVHHLEEVRNETESEGEAILMITLDRIMLLNGVLNNNFCRVIWEILVDDLVQLQVQHAVETTSIGSSSSSQRKQLIFWYLKENSNKSPEERIALAHVGLDSLQCHKVVAVPADDIMVLVKKAESVVPAHILDVAP